MIIRMAFIAALLVPSLAVAATYRVETNGPIAKGSFLANDANNDGWIETSEILSSKVSFGWRGGTPNDWWIENGKIEKAWLPIGTSQSRGTQFRSFAAAAKAPEPTLIAIGEALTQVASKVWKNGRWEYLSCDWFDGYCPPGIPVYTGREKEYNVLIQTWDWMEVPDGQLSPVPTPDALPLALSGLGALAAVGGLSRRRRQALLSAPSV